MKHRIRPRSCYHYTLTFSRWNSNKFTNEEVLRLYAASDKNQSDVFDVIKSINAELNEDRSNVFFQGFYFPYREGPPDDRASRRRTMLCYKKVTCLYHMHDPSLIMKNIYIFWSQRFVHFSDSRTGGQTNDWGKPWPIRRQQPIVRNQLLEWLLTCSIQTRRLVCIPAPTLRPGESTKQQNGLNRWK